MQGFAFYAGIFSGAFILSILVELVIVLVSRMRKRDVGSRPQPLLNRDRLIRMLFVTAIFFVLSVFGNKN